MKNIYAKFNVITNKLSFILLIVVGILVIITLLTPKPTKVENKESINSSQTSSQNTYTDKISKLTSIQKISQLFFIGLNSTALDNTSIELLKKYPVGGYIFLTSNAKTPTQTKLLVDQLNSINSIKPFLAVDQEGGLVSRLAWDKSKDTKASELTKENVDKVTKDHIDALKLVGLNLNLSPVVDIAENNSIIGSRSISSDVNKVIEIASRQIEIYDENNIFSSLKHYPGIGSIKEDPHDEIAIISKPLSSLEFNDLKAFKSLANKANFIMSTHVIVEDLDKNNPVTFSKTAISKLRDEYNFKGIILTDDLNMNSIKDIENNYLKSLEAGHTMLLTLKDITKLTKTIDELSKLYDNNPDFKKLVDDNLEIIMTVKEKGSLL